MPGRVVDCLFLHDELDLLTVHLALLDGHVDRWVVVEGDRTFAGAPRTSALTAAWDRFAAYHDRIDRVTVALPAEAASRWDRENAQRAGLRAYLEEHLGPDDVAILGDVDELVDPRILPALHGIAGMVRLCLDHACWYADRLLPRPWTNGPIAFRRAHLDDRVVANQLGTNPATWAGYVERRVLGCGLHLWNVVPPDEVRAKWAAYAHAEHDVDRFRGDGFVELCRDAGVTLDGRWLTTAAASSPAGLQAVAPHLFAPGPPPPLRRRQAVAGYAWCRTRLPLPAAALRRPGLALRLLGPALALLHRVLLRRRIERVDADDAWTSTYLTVDELARTG